MLGLRTVCYPCPDLATGKAWYARAFNTEPYFVEPYYVGFNIGGFELGLDPDVKDVKPGPGGTVAYWGVAEADTAVEHFVRAGASLESPVRDVGEGIRVATVADPFGNLMGLIENPHFAAA